MREYENYKKISQINGTRFLRNVITKRWKQKRKNDGIFNIDFIMYCCKVLYIKKNI